MPAGDNPHSISERKATLRESPKQPKSIVSEQQRTSSFPKDNAAAIVGIKRPQPDGPLNPTNHHILGSSGANGHLVYVRRRIETDQNKGGTSASAGSGSVNSGSLKKAVAVGSQSQEPSQNNVHNTQLAPRPAPPASVTASTALPSTGLPAHHSIGQRSPGKVAVHRHLGSSPVLSNSVAAHLASTSNVSATSTASRHAISATTQELKQGYPLRSSNQYCSDRFIRLQAFLRNNEQSSQEEYIRSKQLFYLCSLQLTTIRAHKSFLYSWDICSFLRLISYTVCPLEKNCSASVIVPGRTN